MKRSLTPLKGLDKVKFGMTLKEVHTITGIKKSEVTNKYLKERTIVDDKINYVFVEDSLGLIEINYQEGIYVNDMDLFTTPDADTLIEGHEAKSRKDAIHIKELGLVLFQYRLKNLKKRYVWCYGKNSSKDYEHVLDIV